jgi:ABC-2 type transport system ATP-binding protein
MESSTPPTSGPAEGTAGAGPAAAYAVAAGAAATARPLVEVRGLTKDYGDKLALKGISFTVDEGEIFGFIGPNGAGKTTTIKVLATLLEPSAGEVRIDGLCVQNDTEEVRRLIGYMPDQFGVYEGLTVEEYLEFFAGAYRLPPRQRRARLADVMELTELAKLRGRMVAHLSKGMKQRLCLAKTLIHNPKLLILDEPASALDPRARIELRVLLKELRDMGKTIFISSHILAELSDLCTSVGIIEQGELVESGKVEILHKKRWSRDQVKIKFHDERPEAAALLARSGHVRSLAADGKSLTFDYLGAPEEFYKVIKLLTDNGVPLLSIEHEARNLEDLFMEFTQGEVD